MHLIKADREIKLMRAGGKRLAEVMEILEQKVKPGVSTLAIDQLAEKLILKSGSQPAFKGYGGPDHSFPATICASVNEEIVHGIPAENKILQEGDIFKVDIGLIYQGYYADMARTFPVGQTDKKAKRIIRVVKESFYRGLEQIKKGAWLSAYSRAVQDYAESQGYAVVRNLTGHGIGRQLHEEPSIYNFYDKNNYQDLKLEAGMTLALEPMINEGSYHTVMGKDRWVFKTADGKLSAHWENTVLVTEKGTEILTKTKK